MANEILNTIPTIHAAQLVKKLKKKKKKKMFDDFTDIMVGTTLIQSESKLIGVL